MPCIFKNISQDANLVNQNKKRRKKKKKETQLRRNQIETRTSLWDLKSNLGVYHMSIPGYFQYGQLIFTLIMASIISKSKHVLKILIKNKEYVWKCDCDWFGGTPFQIKQSLVPKPIGKGVSSRVTGTLRFALQGRVGQESISTAIPLNIL